MTSSAVDVLNLPYGATIESDGTRYPKIATKTPNQVDNSAIRLPSGPCRVVLSWNGPEALRLTWSGSGHLTEVPAGSGIRSTTVVVGAKGERSWAENATNAPTKENGRGTIEIYPLFNQGAET